MFTFTTIERYQDYLLDNPEGCVQAVRYYLDRIKTHASLNAYLEVFADEAEARARELDAKRAAGEPPKKLHGVVIALKDVIAYKGHTLSAGSKMLEGFTSLYNATVVDRLLEEDAIIIGRNNCDEFAMGSTNENSAYGPVRNAVGDNMVPGGSSGGSAVAVQADLCMLSLGTDTGGSVRQPADFCGIIGMKPTYGAISRYGVVAYASSFDQIGIFGKVVEDVARVLAVISGPDDYDSTALGNKLEINIPTPSSNIRRPRVAYFREAIMHPSLDPEIQNTLLKFIDMLQHDGAVVEAVPFDYLDFIVPAYYVLTTAEASSNLSRYDGVKYGHRSRTPQPSLDGFYKANRSEGFGREVQRRILLGTFVLSAGHYDAYFTKAQQVRQLLVDKTNEVFQRYDALLLPTAPTTAFPLGSKTDDPIALYLADIYTVFANLAGLPGISLPLFRHSNGLPFGVQVLADRASDSDLLQLSFNWLLRYKV
ncbi:MAG TPA: Asp-tRNA(Asn)/Glu-tRNA(Gln) amidotransferase subunit GatA [Dinghuibacter sp.]|jgi:aspartyl-tRNA(Asn)/glutamyl-tRNA(Gln) amidotransferase subunit A|uniref:Asp-tRNA(Asn)/Glu-tRNA(Gln) amidotransferase subunit GatA n=1 Tax=Dinghuibacter sp. TaxID=2024697 RepID=UPI002BE61DB6|nr:Asp-tRNA(Asn)/Glu-tRNA(Gln) amidotransferase subunit GatA [Dinghuibacter sp.]HTJ12153.1 Asp-tRNA(Asn)/Glu-tRNA(Gln) amidotransferase subunit GatA [Dinghuibacter sp.]